MCGVAWIRRPPGLPVAVLLISYYQDETSHNVLCIMHDFASRMSGYFLSVQSGLLILFIIRLERYPLLVKNAI